MSFLSYYLWDAVPILAGIFLMYVMRSLKLSSEKIEITASETREIISELRTLRSKKQPILLSEADQFGAAVNPAKILGVFAYDNHSEFSEFDGYLCRSSISAKDAVIERIANDLRIISGKAGSLKGVTKKEGFSGLGIFDVHERGQFSRYGTQSRMIRILKPQINDLSDLVLTFGGRGGAVLYYLETYQVEAV